jgi:tetratricopeptide (TPR) repeat protein
MKHAEQVIDSEQWLRERADRLFTAGDSQAESYYRRLLETTTRSDVREHTHLRLAALAHRRRDFEIALDELNTARTLNPQSAEILHARGLTQLQRGHAWDALIDFLEAWHPKNENFVHPYTGIAAALRAVGEGEYGTCVLLGALERHPQNPILLEALGVHYEALQMWLDAIHTRDQLIEVLKRNQPSTMEPTPFLLQATRIEDVEATQHEGLLNLRQSLQLADLPDEDPSQPLTRMQHQTGLHTLIDALNQQPRADVLLPVAQQIWARAVHEKLDIHLNHYTLAATIEWIVLRLHWCPMPREDSWQDRYGIEFERVKAAVRLVVSALHVELFPLDKALGHLTPDRQQRLKLLCQAIVLDVNVESLTPSRMLL